MLFWQITVQPITKMSSKWKHLCLNVRHRDKDCFNITAMVTVNVWEMIKEIYVYIHFQCFLKIIQYIRQVTHWGWDKTGRHFADGVFEWIFLNPQDLIVFQIKLHWDWFHAWFTLLTHICVTQTEWVNLFGSPDTCTIHITSIWNLGLNIFLQDNDYIMDTIA